MLLLGPVAPGVLVVMRLRQRMLALSVDDVSDGNTGSGPRIDRWGLWWANDHGRRKCTTRKFSVADTKAAKSSKPPGQGRGSHGTDGTMAQHPTMTLPTHTLYILGADRRLDTQLFSM